MISIDYLLEAVTVTDNDPGETPDNNYHFTVEDEGGVVGYFNALPMAMFVRMAIIQARLNPLV